MLGVQSTRTAAHRVVHPVSAATSISPPSKANKLSAILPNQKSQNLRPRTRQSRADLDSPPDSSTTWAVPHDDEKKGEEVEEEEVDDAGKVEMSTSEVVHESELASIDALSNIVNPSSLSGDLHFTNEDKGLGSAEEVEAFNFVDFGDDVSEDNGKSALDAVDEKRELSSKLSTPLSELSPLPTFANSGEDSGPFRKEVDDAVEPGAARPSGSLATIEGAKGQTIADSVNGLTESNGLSDDTVTTTHSRPQSPPKPPQKTPTSLSKEPSSQNPSSSSPSHPFESSPLSSARGQSGSSLSPLVKPDHFPRESNEPVSTPSLPGPSTIPLEKLSQNQVSHRKVSVLLELNNELFNACIALQTQNISVNDVDYQTLSKKLQSNLTWLEAQIDKTQANTNAHSSLPELTPPSISPSSSAKIKSFDQVQTLYSQLPALFARDVGRRERRVSAAPSSSRATPVPVSSAPQSSVPSAGSPGRNSTGRISMSPLGAEKLLPTLPTAGVKRERPQSRDRESPSAAKRRDTGEGKSVSTTGLMLPPSTHSLSNLQAGESSHSASTVEGRSSPSVMVPSAMGSSSTNAINRPSSSSSVHSTHSVHNPPLQSSNSASGPGVYSRQQTPQASGHPSHSLGGSSGHVNDQLSMVGNNTINGPGRQNAASPASNLAQLSSAPPNVSEQQHQANRLRLLQYRQAMQQQQQQGMQQQHAQLAGQPGQNHAFPNSLQSQQSSQPSQPHFAQQQQFAQHLQGQATVRQMSPPSTSGGSSSINAFGSAAQQSQIPLGVSQQTLQGGAQSMGTAQASSSLPNMMTNIGAASGNPANAMQRMGPTPQQYYHILRDPSHPLVQSLNAQIPGFSRLPVQQQLHMMQVAMKQHQMQRQAQQVQSSGMDAQRSAIMANNMQANQFRQSGPPSSISPSQLQQSMSQQSQLGANQQIQVSPTDNAHTFSGGGSSMANRGQSMLNNSAMTAGNNAAMAQMNMSIQQRQQLFAMQQQMAVQRGASGMSGNSVVNTSVASGNYANPTMMSPQMLLAAQHAHAERQRLMQQQQASSMNASLSAGSVSGLDSQQFPALRSNPSMPGIARSMRSPSVTDLTSGTPRLGGRMLPGQLPGQIGGQNQNEDYNRALLQAQAQRNAQLQQQALLQGIQPQQLNIAQHQMQSGTWPSHMASHQQPQQFSGGTQTGGVPHLAGQMQNDDYNRALLQAQANRNAQQIQQQALMQGVQPQQLSIQQNQQQMQGGGWPAGALQQQQQQQQQFNSVGQNAAMAAAYGSNTNAIPSPNTFDQGSWPQQHPSPVGSMHGSEHGTVPRQTSATPTPLQQHSPVAQATEFDINNMINW